MDRQFQCNVDLAKRWIRKKDQELLQYYNVTEQRYGNKDYLEKERLKRIVISTIEDEVRFFCKGFHYEIECCSDEIQQYAGDRIFEGNAREKLFSIGVYIKLRNLKKENEYLEKGE